MRRVLLSGLIDAITGITAALLSDHRNIYRYERLRLAELRDAGDPALSVEGCREGHCGAIG